MLDRAVGIYDLQFTESQITRHSMLKPDAQKPFTMLRIEKGGKFRLAIFREEKASGNYQGVLALGTLKATGNEIVMTADTINDKKQKDPKKLTYKLSDDGSALVHKDGTTFLRRTNPEKKAGNADLDVAIAKRQADMKKNAEAPVKK